MEAEQSRPPLEWEPLTAVACDTGRQARSVMWAALLGPGICILFNCLELPYRVAGSVARKKTCNIKGVIIFTAWKVALIPILQSLWFPPDGYCPLTSISWLLDPNVNPTTSQFGVISLLSSRVLSPLSFKIVLSCLPALSSWSLKFHAVFPDPEPSPDSAQIPLPRSFHRERVRS